MRISTLIIFSIFFSCSDPIGKNDIIIEKESDPDEIKIDKNELSLSENTNYFEFTPDTLLNLELVDFDIEAAYRLGSSRIVTGYDQSSSPDSGKDWGDKLLLLNTKNEVLFSSLGVGDVYSFEPHFYKNDNTDKTIIICQLAFEYCFGGEVFVLENEEMTHIGNLDIESSAEETCLTDIVEINERKGALIFTFNSDSLFLEPGSEDILVRNTDISYIYKNKQLTLNKEQL